MRTLLWAVIIGSGLGCVSVPSQAFLDDTSRHNAISEDDTGKMVDLVKRTDNISSELVSAQRGIVRSGMDEESYRTLFCIQRIETSATVIEHDLYGATIASQMSIMLQYRLDERLTLYNVKSALEQTMSAVKFVRDDLNQILGGCGRQKGDSLTTRQAASWL